MIEGTAQIRNGAGIHVRPSGEIFKALKNYSGRITVTCRGSRAEFPALIAILSLGLVCGDGVEIEVDGPDEEAVLSQTIELLEREWDFPPR